MSAEPQWFEVTGEQPAVDEPPRRPSSDDWRPEPKSRRERMRYEPKHAEGQPEPETEET
jgi:hypothetical protein